MPKPSSKPQSPPREKAGGRAVLVVVVVLALLVAGAWFAAYAAAGDELPEGTTIAGVEVGGRTEQQAVQALEEGLADRVEEPMTLVVDGVRVEVTADEAGLGVDHEASVDRAGGDPGWNPAELWEHYTAGDDLEAVITIDEARLQETLDRVNEEAGEPARNGDVSFEGTRVQVIEPEPGQQVEEAELREALSEAFLAEGEDRTVEVELTQALPEIDRADVQQALEEFANPAVSAPVTLRFGESPVRLTPTEYAPALGMKAEDGELVPALKRKKLRRLVDDRVGEAGAPVDATVKLVDGEPTVIPAKPGVTYRPADIADAFLELVTRPEDKREMKVEGTVTKPERTTKEARQLKIREEVSSFTTYYPHAEYRNVNLGRAAELIDGTILEPGETFSMNDTVGERTLENGFTYGTIIANGVYKQDLGGSVSQMATTLFNAMFFAGLEDVEHRPHSFYISRYPVGREATIVWGALDLRFKNDTPYGVLIDTEVTPSTPTSQGEVTVTMYSTDYWDITTTTSERYNFTEPATRTLTSPDCMPNEGYSGFDVDVTRYFRRAGEDELHHKEVFHTTYTPSDTVICKPPDDED